MIENKFRMIRCIQGVSPMWRHFVGDNFALRYANVLLQQYYEDRFRNVWGIR